MVFKRRRCRTSEPLITPTSARKWLSRLRMRAAHFSRRPCQAELSQEFRNSAEHMGSWGLELVAVRRYLNRLMDSHKLVRYLAHHFPKQLAQFQDGLETA
ncbi:plasmid partitioning protein RepB C-terminal domain-containing protein [Mesorhizobium sp.]|uniref:plasmid partitioning protein RepB C-terminal domain-containing protein n=2 Tax=Mesorhizobium sp. TaxID=1871066 RepID=UPI0034499CFB